MSLLSPTRPDPRTPPTDSSRHVGSGAHTSHRAPERARRSTIVLALAVGVVLAGLASQALWPSAAPSTTGSSPIADLVPGALPPREGPGRASDGLGLADGAVPDGVTVFDDEVPAVANLDGALLAALRGAAAEAEGDGVELHVNSGWRSPAYQAQLLRDAISEYGSEEEAARWVSTPDTSLHVAGAAIDIGGSDATRWLSRNGAGYGLCQVYDNEPWHFELRADAVEDGCPGRYADPTQDPRMGP